MNDRIPDSPNLAISQLLESALLKALSPIVTRLDRIEAYLNHQQPVTHSQKQQLDSLERETIDQRQSMNKLIECITTLSNATDNLSRLTSNSNYSLTLKLGQLQQQVEQCHQQQNQQLCEIEFRIGSLVNTLIPLPQEMHHVREQLHQRLDDQQLQLEKLSSELNNIASYTQTLSSASVKQIQQQTELSLLVEQLSQVLKNITGLLENDTDSESY